MKKSVYIDSTIPSYYYDNRSTIQAFIEVTRKWWDFERENYEVLTSSYTIVELSDGEYPNKRNILKLVENVPILETNIDIINIAEAYIREFVMPKEAGGDAYHLACASFYRSDYLLTWNCNHLANANKKQHIQIVNNKLGLFTPNIITPLELF